MSYPLVISLSLFWCTSCMRFHTCALEHSNYSSLPSAPLVSTVLVLLGLSCVIFLVLHQLRRRLKAVDDIYLHLIGPLLRPKEIRGELPGAFWFLLGAAGAVAIFPRDVALQRYIGGQVMIQPASLFDQPSARVCVRFVVGATESLLCP